MKRANLTLSSQMQPWQSKAAQIAGRGVGKKFHSGFNSLSIRIKKGMSSHAYTRESSESGKMIIKFNPSKHKSRNEDKRIGKLSQTLSHEMYLHARRDLRAQKNKSENSTAESDHGRMHSSSHRDGFLSVSHETFKRLENTEQKKAFSSSWYKDMKNEIEDSGVSSRKQVERTGWARQRRNSMVDAITNPGSHPWAL